MALPQPDQRTLENARLGDERAFASLVQSYRRPVLAYVHRMVGDSGLAEDLVQDVFLRVYQRLGSFRGNCLFTTWLFQVARNRVLDEFRAQARRPVAQLELTEVIVGSQHAPERHGEIDETVAAIWEAVARLDIDLKLPLLLRDMSGLSYREIAATLDIQLATVKWRIYTARETIQRALATNHIAPEFARVADRRDASAEPAHTKLSTLPTLS